MNTPRPHPAADAALERLLDEGGGEYGRLYRKLPHMEPPRRLDRAVLGEAARAVRGHDGRHAPRWAWLGSAAGIVLAAGIAWRIGHDLPPAPPLPPAPEAGRSIQVRPVDARPASPSTGRDAPAAGAATRPETALGQARESSPPTAPAPAAMPAPSAAPPPARNAAAMREAAPAMEAAPARPATPPAAPPPPAAAARKVMAAPEPFPSSRADMEMSETSPAPSAAPSEAAADDGATASGASRRAASASPEAWLEEVRALFARGEDARALARLREFRARWPQAALPADLAQRLAQGGEPAGKR